MSDSLTNPSNKTYAIDVNDPEFYENVQTVIESDMAGVKKNIEIMMNLRLTAAEVEVETAALYHTQLWYDLLAIQLPTEMSDEEDLKDDIDSEDVTDDDEAKKAK